MGASKNQGTAEKEVLIYDIYFYPKKNMQIIPLKGCLRFWTLRAEQCGTPFKTPTVCLVLTRVWRRAYTGRQGELLSLL